jgi:hypothetical protein
MMNYHMEHSYSSLYPEVLKKYLSPVFVETGTNTGEGIQTALDVGFDRIYSIESDKKLLRQARKRFSGNERVSILQGDSPRGLSVVGQRLSRSCTFYLDAHSIERNPLLEELEVLSRLPCRTHTLLIDDVRMFGSLDWHGLKKQTVLEAVWNINKRYRISYEDTRHAAMDLLVAQP